MQNISFLKEAILNTYNNNTLIELNLKQQKVSIPFIINSFLENEKVSIILVNTSQDIIELQNTFKEDFNKIQIIDTTTEEQINLKNVFYTNNPSDLTKIQIGIEKLSLISKKPKIIIFDSLNNILIHADKKNVQRFFYLFNNKTKLEGNSSMILTAKELTDSDTLETIKQFSDAVFDYAELFISSIELKE